MRNQTFFKENPRTKAIPVLQSCTMLSKFADDRTTARKPPERTYRAHHLDTPLRGDSLHYAADYIATGVKDPARVFETRDLEWLENLLPKGTSLEYDYTQLFLFLWRKALTGKHSLHEFTRGISSTCEAVCQEAIRLQWECVEKLGGSSEAPVLRSASEKTVRSIEAMKIYLAEIVTLTSDPKVKPSGMFKDKLQKSGESSRVTAVGDSSFRIWGSENYVFARTTEGQFLITRDQFLCISDLIHQRYMAFLACFLAYELENPLYPTPTTLLEILNWGDYLLGLLGNEAYRIIGLWEPLCLGALQSSEPDELVDNTQFFKVMLDRLDAECLELGVDSVRRSTEGLLRKLVQASPHHLSQAFGLYRIWGHPVVHPLQGVHKLRGIACVNKVPHDPLIRRVTCKAKEIFSMNYYQKNRRWPPMDLSRLPEGNYLKDVISHGAELVVRHPRYSLEHWWDVKFQKTFNVMESLDLSDMISDKSTSLDKTPLLESLRKNRGIGPSWERSVLYSHCRQEMTKPAEILESVSKSGFGDEESVVGVCAKERELKPEPRLFGLLTLRKRMYVVITEALLAHDVLPFYPDITMMDDHLALTRKIMRMTKQHQNWRSILTVLDFEKWNSHMREAETLELFTFFDDLYGLENVFTRSHEMFSKSQLYLADSSYRPKVDEEAKALVEDEGCWSGHLGGIEGLRQKGWTIFTVALLRLVADEAGISVSLMGQGDNQVMKCTFPAAWSTEQIQQVHQRFAQKLISTTQLIGPPLKASETWSSSNFFIYGKYPVLKELPLSVALKREVRIFPSSNEGFPNLDNCLSSIFANVSAACAHDMSPVIPYFLGLHQACLALTVYLRQAPLHETPLRNSLQKNPSILLRGVGTRRHEIHKPLSTAIMKNISKPSHSFLLGVLLFPKSWGGLSTQLFGSLFNKGFPDQQSQDCALLRQVYHRAKPELRAFIVNMLSPVFSPFKSSVLLAQDPTALNLPVTASPGDAVKRAITRMLRHAKWITNPKIKEFLALSVDGLDVLCDYLIRMEPCNTRVIHEIVEGTLYGRALHLVNQLNKTSTMSRIARNTGESSLRDTATRADYFLCVSVLHQLGTAGNKTWNSFKCSTLWTDECRREGWGLPISGVTVAPPVEMFRAVATETADCEEEGHPNSPIGYILCRARNEMELNEVMRGEAMGSHLPYIGSRTIEKVTARGKEESKTAVPLLRIPFALQALQGWGVAVGSPLSLLLNRLVTAISNRDPLTLHPRYENIKGSLEHRFMDSATKHGGTLPILYLFASAWYLSSDTLVAYSKGGGNHNLHFQATYSTLLTALSTRVPPLRPLATSWHFHQDCTDCCFPIHEDLLKLPPSSIPLEQLIPSRPDNPFCWIEEPCQPQVMAPWPQPRVNPLDLTQESLRVLFSLKMGIELAHQLREAMPGFSQIGYSQARRTVSIPWVFKAVPIFTIEGFVLALTSHLIRSKANLFAQESLERALQSVLDAMNNLPAGLFCHLADLEARTEFFSRLTEKPYFLSPCPAVPPTVTELGHSWKRHSVDILHRWLLDEVPYEHLENIIHVGLPFDLDFNPTMLLAALKLLQAYPDFTPGLSESVTAWITVSGKAHHEAVEAQVEVAEGFVQLAPDEIDEEVIVAARRLTKCTLDEPVLVENLDLMAKRLTEYHPLVEPSVTPVIHHGVLASSVLGQMTWTDCERHPTEIYIPNTPIDAIESSNWTAMYKTDGSVTTAPYKVLSFVDLLPTKAESVACLGEGAGGILAFLGRFYPSARMFYNTLIDTADACLQALPSLVPPGVLPFPQIRDRIEQLRFTLETDSDLTDESFAFRASRAFEGPVDVLTCDAEGHGWDSPVKGLLLSQTFGRLCKIWDVRCGVFKTYGSNPYLVVAQMTVLLSHFKEVKVVRSHFSYSNNTEVYLIASGAHDPLDIRITTTPSLTSSHAPLESVANLIIQNLTAPNSFSKSASAPLLDAARKILETPWSKQRVESLLVRHCPMMLWRKGHVTYPHDIAEALFTNRELVKGQSRRAQTLTSASLLTRPAVRQLLTSYLSWVVVWYCGNTLTPPDDFLSQFTLITYQNVEGRTISVPVVETEAALWPLRASGLLFAYYPARTLGARDQREIFRLAGCLRGLSSLSTIYMMEPKGRPFEPRNPQLRYLMKKMVLPPSPGRPFATFLN
uniref:Replicase n=1 Tax=Yanbian Rhabd tick virus 2 TaxID=2972330 RepID=A0A9E7V2A6_9RHAB|nr:MAG: RNA-dependent RNA polymerase [Yanbian Rhabd tick virus 2]